MSFALAPPLPTAAPAVRARSSRRRAALSVRASATVVDEDTGIKLARKGIKEAADENVLTPRFYTTDFEEMARSSCQARTRVSFAHRSSQEQLFGGEWSNKLNQLEIEAMLAEFRYDYNQKAREEKR